ncbi:hypothetical protein QNH28_12285 [Paenibacillus sp. G2S3]|uniref:hypothetical protein n=1 Tax=Paenibacillus sp. G2S3 TaxID=3047872 RepID=UPI0024C1E5FA|nr:hypothetical protein [Paenibacillus sp. G2S3]WHY22505.1 hypothetical protein QNH28_12285 [Paenibacillus sp. G2S3]
MDSLPMVLMTLSKEGKKIIFKEGAIKVSYTSLVPAAALAKALDVTAEWNSKLYQLTIQTKR